MIRCPPTGRLKGPLEPNGCGAAGNFTDGFTPPEMFLAAATAPGIEGAIHWQTVLMTVQEHTVPSAASGTMHQKNGAT